MARVVVVGGGLGGAAAAARLAKLRHEVVLLEAREELGGALGYVESDGFRWDAGPVSTLLPAVLRDLFRKSGRPLERELELVPVEPAREHRFTDGSVLGLPAGSRAGQHHAIAAALGPRAADEWLAYTHGFADTWELLRRDYLERPWSPDHADPRTRELLTARTSLHRAVRHGLRDRRLREVAWHEARMGGHDPKDVPAWTGVLAYVEQKFGVWTAPEGMGAFGTALARRLEERRVDVRLGTAARDVVVEGGRAREVLTATGPVAADVVVVAIDPRRLPALAGLVHRTMPALPPQVVHVGLSGEVPRLPHEVVLHGEPTVVVRTNGQAPGAGAAWTLLGRGRVDEDLLVTLARRGIDVRRQVAVRVDLSPRDVAERYGGSPYGVLWQGRRTLERQAATTTPWPNVLCAGAHAAPGAGVPFVGLGAALVAQVVGRA